MTWFHLNSIAKSAAIGRKRSCKARPFGRMLIVLARKKRRVTLKTTRLIRFELLQIFASSNCCWIDCWKEAEGGDFGGRNQTDRNLFRSSQLRKCLSLWCRDWSGNLPCIGLRPGFLRNVSKRTNLAKPDGGVAAVFHERKYQDKDREKETETWKEKEKEKEMNQERMRYRDRGWGGGERERNREHRVWIWNIELNVLCGDCVFS